MTATGWWSLLMIVIISFCAQREFGWRGMWIFLGVLVVGFFAMMGMLALLGKL